MDVYKAKIQSDGSLDKLKLRIVVRGDFQNKEMVGDTWSPTASMRNLKYFLEDAAKHKTKAHQQTVCQSWSSHIWTLTILRLFQSIVSILESKLHLTL